MKVSLVIGIILFSTIFNLGIAEGAPITKLVFTTSPQALDQNEISGAITVQTQDASGTPTNVSANTTINLTTTSSGGEFSDSSNFNNTVTRITIRRNRSTANFYYRDSIAGTPTITAAENPSQGWTDATQSVTINDTTITKLVIATSAQTLNPDEISSVITVQTQNAAGTAINVSSNTTINLSSTSTGGEFSDSSNFNNTVTRITIRRNSSSADFYYRDSQTGTATITASETPSQGWTDATQNVTIIDTTITKLVFTTSVQTLNQNQISSAMTVQTQNAPGTAVNVSSNTTLNLSSSSTGGQFSATSDFGTTVIQVTISSGQSTATFYYRDSVAGTPTITAAETPSQGWTDATQSVTISDTTISKLVFTTSEQTLDQNQISSAVTVQTQNASGTAINVSSNTTIDLLSSSTGGTFSDNINFTTTITQITISSGQSTGTFYYRDSKAGTPTITAAENPSQGWTDATQSVTINVTATKFAVNVASPQIAGSSFSMTVTAQDNQGNTMASYSGTANLTVSFISPTFGSGTVSTTSVSGFINGVVTVSNQTFSNCGTIRITAADSADSSITGTSSSIVFAPSDFVVEFENLDQTTPSFIHTVNQTFTLKITARTSSATTCTNHQGTATVAITEVDPSTQQSGTVSPSSLTSSDWTSGIATKTEATYNKWGKVRMKCTDGTLTTRTGTSADITFLPKDFSIVPEAPPVSRAFYYLDEPFQATVTARDQNNNTVSNYQGTITFVGTGFELPANYTFSSEDAGSHLFSDIQGSIEGEGTISVQDTTYSTVSGQSDEISIKEAFIKVNSNTGPVGSLDIPVTIVDSDGNIITEDDATTFTIQMVESLPDNSAESDATSEATVVSGGKATIVVRDTDAETVTISAESTPTLSAIEGTATFGTASRSGVGINLYREIKGTDEQ